MTLTEMLMSFNNHMLRNVITEYKVNMLKLYPYLRSPRHLDEILLRGTKELYVSTIESLFNELNVGQARKILNKINATSITIDNKDHFSAAIIFGFVPKEALRDIAISNNISIPEAVNSRLGALLPGSKRDSEKWALVAKMAAVVNGDAKPTTEGIHSFCPDCKEDNPAEADHCMSCGRALPLITCPECGVENPPEAKFCMSCGEKR